ncbi:EscU/YscU/HrcU family type III secretion system export apparatus switch protein [Magnetofaba australis]|uniref:Putative flagellar biosynthetic protein (FlhB)-like protein n=1 Tax=Magnetofaba australis IT-1 TaxID=1434232 RepID=A0A1Y2K244_9PROT|nr:EscU/YscU/HrcU family type III secretion system export apparatus switch protein [Magnetofaba australis]OSM02073.1 putative flagellar biosynthetic protein (FlhB)-like protein [Magnetofaba australis IT-1]
MSDGSTRKTHHQRKAVALRYKRGSEPAPRVSAAGRGRVAETILAKAAEAGVPLVEDADLVNLLDKVPVGESIPPVLYKAVAEVLSYVYRVNRRFAERLDAGE